MITDVTKKYRDYLAFALLAVAVLWFVAALGLLFKSSPLSFADKSDLVGGLFESSVPLISLVVAVILVTRYGDGPSRYARFVVLAALALGAIDLVFGIITYVAQFSADDELSNDYLASGKVVGAFMGLALLLFLGVALAFILTTFQSLPPVTSRLRGQWAGGQWAGGQWAAGGPGYGAPGHGGPGYGGPGYGAGGYGGPGYGQPGPEQGWGAGPPAWGQRGAPGWSPAGQAPPPAPGWGWGNPGPGYRPGPPTADGPDAEPFDGAEEDSIDVSAEEPAEAGAGSVPPGGDPPPEPPAAGHGWWQRPEH